MRVLFTLTGNVPKRISSPEVRDEALRVQGH
jgi:hypothetical protein